MQNCLTLYCCQSIASGCMFAPGANTRSAGELSLHQQSF